MNPFRTWHVFSRVRYHRTWRQQLIGTRKHGKAIRTDALRLEDGRAIRTNALRPLILPCSGALRVCRALREKYKNDPRHAEYRKTLAATSDDDL